MTSAELKDALMRSTAVICDTGINGDIEYSKVSAIIYRIIDGSLTVCAELSDKSGRSVTVVRADNVRVKLNS